MHVPSAIESPRVYAGIFVVLLALTGATLVLGHVDLGLWHTVVGMLVASIKAALIILFFMHVLRSTPLTWMVALGGLLWLGLLIGGTLTDVLSRDWKM